MLSVVWLAGCASAPPPSAVPGTALAHEVSSSGVDPVQATAAFRATVPPTADYRIGPQDVLEIKVFEQETMSTSCRVGGDGTIRFPPLGVLAVSNLSEREVEGIIEDKLRGGFVQDPHVTVFIREPHAREVSVVGEVKTPGRFPVFGQLSLLDVLSRAGGVTELAGGYAYVMHGDPATGRARTAPAGQAAPDSVKVDLSGLLLRGEEAWNVPLQAGDSVAVPGAGFVHVTGLGVKKAGMYPLKGSTSNTLRQMVDNAEGLNFSASKHITLLRKAEGRGSELIPVNFSRILDDGRNDILVQNGDTIIVDRNAFRTVVGAIGAAIAKIVNVSVYYSVSSSSGYGRR